MKITFLGTSHGYPETGRNLSCTMLEIGDQIYFIDAGAPLGQFVADRKMDRTKIKALFITHRHGDHMGGSFIFLGTINEYWKDTSIDVVMPEERAISLVQQVLLNCTKRIDNSRIHFFNLMENPSYEDENLKLTAFPNEHTNGTMASYSFLIEAEGKKLLFTGDLHAKLHDFPEVAFGEEKLDLIVCEYAHSRHEFMDPVIGKLNTKRLFFNHVYPYTKLEEIEDWNKVHEFEILYVNDNDEFEL